MIFEYVFWLWFVIASLLSVYILFESFLIGFVFSVLVIGTGVSRLAEYRSRKRENVKVRKDILSKLEG